MRIPICLLWIVIPAVTGSLSAYEIRESDRGVPICWGESPFPLRYFIQRSGSGDVADSSDISAIQSAFQTWENVSTGGISFQFAGLVEREEIDPSASVVMWMEEDWPYDRHYVAKTRIHYSRAEGRILKVEVVLNGRDYRWSTNGEEGTLDVQNVATHEVGHFIGLGDVQATDAAMFEYIFPGEVFKRHLADDDIEGISALYPRVSGNESILVQKCILDEGERRVRPLENAAPLPGTGGFATLCPLTHFPGSPLGLIRSRDGGLGISLLTDELKIARGYLIKCGKDFNFGRIRAVSSFVISPERASGIAALLSTHQGMFLAAGILPPPDSEVEKTAMTIAPVGGADDVVGFSILSSAENDFTVATVRKKQNRDYFISLSGVRGSMGNGEEISLDPYLSWRITDCARILGLAARERSGGEKELLLLSINERGGMEILIYPLPHRVLPKDGEPWPPALRADASEIASKGRPLAISALPPSPDGRRRIAVLSAR